MDYKYIEQLIERYWNAETSLEKESILRTFFSQKNVPAEMEHLRALFSDDASGQTLDDDFDKRMLQMIQQEDSHKPQDTVKAREVSISMRFMPLFKAAAIVAIILTLGGALQAPWDKSWNTPEDYATLQQGADTVAAIHPIQAENSSYTPALGAETFGDVQADSTAVTMPEPSRKD